MMKYGSRKINVKKADLIAKIKENKENHIVEYNKAVIAYKEEALFQLASCVNRVEEGSMDIALNLVTPIDNSKNYDKIIEMFTWEVNDVVELEQSEFIEYVQDETQFALEAKFSNTAYTVLSNGREKNRI